MTRSRLGHGQPIGRALQTVVQNVMGSAEYLHGSRSDASFVQFLYQNGLGRTPSASEVKQQQRRL